MKESPFISIIIPVKNAERTIGEMFKCLLALDYPKDKMEILVADGGSKDKTLDLILEEHKKNSFFKLVEIPNCKSPGQARNCALEEASGEYLFFTDADCAPQKDWIEKILAPFLQDEKIGGVGGEILTLKVEENNNIESYCEQTHFLSPTGRCGVFNSGLMPTLNSQKPSEVDGSNNSPFFATANVAFSKKAMNDAGGKFWDEITGEDVDFSVRLLKKGYRLYYNKEAVVFHMHRATLKTFCHQWNGYGFGHPLLIDRHARKVFEIVFQFGKNFSIVIPSRKPGIIHIGNFHLLNLSFVLSFLLLIFSSVGARLPDGQGTAFGGGLIQWAVGFGILFLVTSYFYFRPCFGLRPKRNFLNWCLIRYFTNWCYIKGGLQGSRKFKTVCLEGSW